MPAGMIPFRITKERKLTIIIVICLTMIVFFARIVFFNDKFSVLHNVFLFFISITVVLLMWEILARINFILEKRMPYEEGIARRIALQLLLSLLVVLGIRAALIFFYMHWFPANIQHRTILIVMAFFADVMIVSVINAGYFGAHFFREWKKGLVRNERLQRERTQVQFDNLKNQLNPHFLFNSLTSLNSLIFANQELASQFLQQLSKVYRYVLQNKDKHTVSLATEINFIRNYIFLLKTRFGNSLRVNINIEPKEEDAGIVPVTLQILIENAVKHNLMSEEQPLVIDIYTQNQYLVVTNNLQRKRIVESSHKIGLENMRSLYSFLSEKPMEMPEDAEFFTVKIPLL